MIPVSAAMQANINSQTPHLSIAWLIVRTDGQRFAFTSWDIPFSYSIDGVNTDTYEPINSMDGTANAAKVDLSVQNGNTTTIYSESLTERDLNGGLFDDARVKIFWIDPSNTSAGVIPIQGGRLGEMTFKNVSFDVELRGASQVLQQSYGRTYTLECYTDYGSQYCQHLARARIWRPQFKFVNRTSYNIVVRPRTFNGYWYTTPASGGWTGATEPTWPTSAGRRRGRRSHLDLHQRPVFRRHGARRLQSGQVLGPRSRRGAELLAVWPDHVADRAERGPADGNQWLRRRRRRLSPRKHAGDHLTRRHICAAGRLRKDAGRLSAEGQPAEFSGVPGYADRRAGAGDAQHGAAGQCAAAEEFGELTMTVQVRARKAVADQARTWVDTPFKHWGRTKGKEVDCAGLILGVGAELNIAPVPVIEGYGVSPHEEFVLRYCDKHLIAVDRKYPDFAMGDIVLFWGVERGAASTSPSVTGCMTRRR